MSTSSVVHSYSELLLPCQVDGGRLWFAESPDDVEIAKSLCGQCPLRRECLEGAMSRAEPWGVWGGQLFLSGAIVERKRPRGRPRKESVAA
ncbi:putative transcriptional regulator WhiB7 [Austwickia sp. TVS 96-490-7B]|uniref:WhiB family transcriptional regulator n=1 Tax=Austwickia sp. TVS 96-490-7B TaxID=2830843 RepID=UPI001C582637|nr:WhiB family transcriptional regulator [Austwickia sp. TVS 96-490-7B]MBW3086618.1 putative transcriptional regulator WhiB7 [Austwickia sp. TVS 96-490-7B]